LREFVDNIATTWSALKFDSSFVSLSIINARRCTNSPAFFKTTGEKGRTQSGQMQIPAAGALEEIAKAPHSLREEQNCIQIFHIHNE